VSRNLLQGKKKDVPPGPNGKLRAQPVSSARFKKACGGVRGGGVGWWGGSRVGCGLGVGGGVGVTFLLKSESKKKALRVRRMESLLARSQVSKGPGKKGACGEKRGRKRSTLEREDSNRKTNARKRGATKRVRRR